ncbi:Hypp6884 [Branchiostoma lanceolatum]|uniref:Hypp6884 protein n=1 Tax=Branchiostoma lanceolatum TaxID=7740 RepID=A0A8J9YVT4_BRALA|nr:Hypp6884 [Branchiostoma lanceolatum]
MESELCQRSYREGTLCPMAKYIGRTTEVTRLQIDKSKGGVMVIDEAYRLAQEETTSSKDVGKEALEELMSVMEGGDPIMIFAGYPEEMASFVEVNPGMKSRSAFKFRFPDFSVNELAQIIRIVIAHIGLQLSPNADQALPETIGKSTTEKQRSEMNGRFARQVAMRAEKNMYSRCYPKDVDGCQEYHPGRSGGCWRKLQGISNWKYYKARQQKLQECGPERRHGNKGQKKPPVKTMKAEAFITNYVKSHGQHQPNMAQQHIPTSIRRSRNQVGDTSNQNASARNNTAGYTSNQNASAHNNTACDTSNKDASARKNTAGDTSNQNASARNNTAGYTSNQNASARNNTADDTSNQNASAHNNTAGDTSNQDASARNNTAGDTSNQNASAHNNTAGETSNQNARAHNNTAGDTSNQDASARNSTAGDTSNQNASAHNNTAGETSNQNARAHNNTAGDTSNQNASARNSTAGDTSNQNDSGRNTSGRNTSANHTSANNTSANNNTFSPTYSYINSRFNITPSTHATNFGQPCALFSTSTPMNSMLSLLNSSSEMLPSGGMAHSSSQAEVILHELTLKLKQPKDVRWLSHDALTDALYKSLRSVLAHLNEEMVETKKEVIRLARDQPLEGRRLAELDEDLRPGGRLDGLDIQVSDKQREDFARLRRSFIDHLLENLDERFPQTELLSAFGVLDPGSRPVEMPGDYGWDEMDRLATFYADGPGSTAR